MKQFENVHTDDVITVQGAVADYYEKHPDWKLVGTVKNDAPAAAPQALSELTVEQLREYAKAEDVTLSRGDDKATIIKKIEEK